jgi:hypothetical protein
MLRRVSLPITIVSLAISAVAFGQPQDPRESQARKDCLTGKVESGVALLAEMFIETKKPTLIYNQGRCFEQNGRPEEAINRFREYLRLAKNLSNQEKEEAEKHIADCRTLLAEQKPAAAPAPSQPVVPSPAPPVAPSLLPTTPAPLPAPAPVETSSPPPPPATEPSALLGGAPNPPQATAGSNLRLAGVIVGASGIAGLVTGGIFSALVSNAKKKAESNAKDGFYDSSLNSRGKTYETMQWVAYGAGAGLLATGVLMYTLSAQDKTQAATVSLLPSLAPRQGGVLLQGSF